MRIAILGNGILGNLARRTEALAPDVRILRGRIEAPVRQSVEHRGLVEQLEGIVRFFRAFHHRLQTVAACCGAHWIL